MENWREKSEYFSDQVNQKTDIPILRIWFLRTQDIYKSNQQQQKNPKTQQPKKIQNITPQTCW